MTGKTDTQRIAELERQLHLVKRRLDEFFRSNCLPPLIDEQEAAINARSAALARGQAA